MKEILDDLFFQCQQLSDGDLEVLLSAMMREQKERDCKKQKEAWAKVCEAIAHYTANFGNIRVADCCGDDENVICLHYGEFAFGEYGDIEVGA